MEEFRVMEEFLSALEKEYSEGFLLQSIDTPIAEVVALRSQLQLVRAIKYLPEALEECKKRLEKAKEIQENMKRQNAEVL